MIPENSNRACLALGGTDMRKAINGLSVLVEQDTDLDQFSGDLFVCFATGVKTSSRFCTGMRTGYVCGKNAWKSIALNSPG
jgi:hypothetical protein